MLVTKMQFLVVNRSSVIVVVEVLSCCVFFVSSVRANTVKQEILYPTCTGPGVTMIG